MVKTHKRITVLILAMIFIMGCMTSAVFADRNDTSYKFTFNSKNAEMEHSAWREKDNKTKVYIKVNSVQSTSDYVKGWIQGKKYKASTSYSNCSGGYEYKLNKKGEQWMTNYVKENGNGYARIAAYAPEGSINVIQGVWSPDSGKQG